MFETHTLENTSTNDDKVASPQLFQPPALAKFLRAHTNDSFCPMEITQVGHTNSKLNINTDGLLTRRSLVDEALQIVVAPSLLQRFFTQSHYPAIKEHPRQLCMYNTLRREFDRLHMAANIESIVSKCHVY